jgi:enoyl-[acyl-carrier protein] reductase I
VGFSVSLEGLKGLVLGVANPRSIAWGIARALAEGGAELGLTYQLDRLKGNVEALADEVDAAFLVPCDVRDDNQIETLFATARDAWTGIDFLVHSVAYADVEDLERDYLGTSRDGYVMAHEISAYSLTKLCQGAAPLMPGGGSIVTLSFLGAERVVPRYNVMGVAKASLEASVRYLAYDLGPRGIRVNGISAGPVKTLAATAVAGFSLMQKHVRNRAPLRRNVTLEEIGAAARFLISPAASGITGEVIHVDGGFHVVGL